MQEMFAQTLVLVLTSPQVDFEKRENVILDHGDMERRAESNRKWVAQSDCNSKAKEKLRAWSGMKMV